MSLSASFPKINNRVFLKGEHQAAVVYLGQLALTDLPSSDLTAQAASLITQVLQVEHCLVWELMQDRHCLLSRSDAREDSDASALALIPVDPDSLEGKTLSSPDPIILENPGKLNGHKPLGMIEDLGLRSGVSVRIGTLERPYGVIEVFSQQVGFFSQNDIQFLQSIANLLGMSFHHDHRSSEQPVARSEMVSARSMVQPAPLEWDRYEIKNRLIESREKERLHLAQELHDTPIQDLYGMIYQLDDLREAMKDPEGDKIVDECEHTLHRVVNSLRTICRELRPPSLSPFGLEVAIRDHVEKFRDQNMHINVNLDLMPDKQILSDSLRLTLFRIYQQAIQNVARHAQASEIHIRFRWDDKTVVLDVEDNGRGFEVPKHWMELVREEHFGLLGIAERVESIRGKLEIVSAPGAGTLVRAIIPYA